MGQGLKQANNKILAEPIMQQRATRCTSSVLSVYLACRFGASWLPVCGCAALDDMRSHAACRMFWTRPICRLAQRSACPTTRLCMPAPTSCTNMTPRPSRPGAPFCRAFPTLFCGCCAFRLTVSHPICLLWQAKYAFIHRAAMPAGSKLALQS